MKITEMLGELGVQITPHQIIHSSYPFNLYRSIVPLIVEPFLDHAMQSITHFRNLCPDILLYFSPQHLLSLSI